MLHLIANAHVFAPEDLGVRHLLVGSGRFLSVVNDPDDISAPGLTVTDLDGRRLIPGFIDGHAHITGGGGESGFSSRVPPVPLSRFTSAGVTSVVGVLGTDDTTRDTRSVVAQARALREEGMSAWCHTGGYHVPPTTLTGSVRDDIVFIDPIIGVGEIAICDHRSSHPTLDELLRIASDAHVAGMISGKAGILHIHLGDGEEGLSLVRDALEKGEVPARTYNPTHINRNKRVFDEAVALAGQGCTVDITAYPVEDDDPGYGAADALSRYLASGAPATNITISSDGGGCLPEFNEQGEMTKMGIGSPLCLADTLRELLDAGADLEQVLPAFTSNVASLLRLRDKGSVGPGFAADCAVLDANHRITDVMVNGVWHVKGGEQKIFGQFEQGEDA